MTIRITKSNQSGFSSVPGDEINEVIINLQNYLPTVFEETSFSIDLTFDGKYSSGTGGSSFTYLPATNNTSSFNWSSVGLTYTKISASVARISGPIISPFSDQYYRFVLPDLSLQVLPRDTTVPFFSLERYHMPSPVSIMKTYTIDVTIPADPIDGGSETTETISLYQWVHWSYSTAVAAIASVRSRGLK
jgi:hypothetical protein